MNPDREILFMRAIAGVALAAFAGLLWFRYQQWCGEFGTPGTIGCSIAIAGICLFAMLGPAKLLIARWVQNIEIALFWAILSAFRFLMHKGFMEAYLFAGVAVIVAGTAMAQWRKERKAAAGGEQGGIASKVIPGRIAN